MLRLNRRFLLILLFGVTGFVGCGDKLPANGGNSAVVVTNQNQNTPNAAPPASPAKTENAAKREKIGVPECDEYLEKYESCLNKMSPTMQEQVRKSLDIYYKSWKETAAKPAERAELGKGCKDIMDITRQTTSTYGCVW